VNDGIGNGNVDRDVVSGRRDSSTRPVAGRIPVAAVWIDPRNGGEDYPALQRFEPGPRQASHANVASRSLPAADSGCGHGDLRMGKATGSLFESLAGSIGKRIVGLCEPFVGSLSRRSPAPDRGRPVVDGARGVKIVLPVNSDAEPLEAVDAVGPSRKKTPPLPAPERFTEHEGPP